MSLKNLEVIQPQNLDSTVSFLKEFGRDEKARNLIEEYIKKRSNEPDLFDLKRHVVFKIEDPDVRNAFDRKASELVEEKDPTEVLRSVVTNRGWGSEDEALIGELNADDFYKLFKKEKRDNLREAIKGVMIMDLKMLRTQEGTLYGNEQFRL